MQITNELKNRLFNLVDSDLVPYGLSAEDCPVMVTKEGNVKMQLYIYDRVCGTEMIDDDLIVHQFDTQLDYADDTANHCIDLDSLLTELLTYVDDSRFRKELIGAFATLNGSDGLYSFLKQRNPDTNNTAFSYDDADFFKLLSGEVNADSVRYGGDTLSFRKDLIDQNLEYLLENYDEYSLDADDCLVEDNFFDSAFRIAHKYRLLNEYDRFHVKSDQSGCLTIVEADDMDIQTRYECVELRNCDNADSYKNAFSVGQFHDVYGSKYVTIELFHPQNQKDYEGMTLIGYDRWDALAFLGEIYEKSVDFLSHFDRKRGVGLATRMFAEGVIDTYNLICEGNSFDCVDYEFQQNEDGDWEVEGYEHVCGGYITDDIQTIISELQTPEE